MINQGEIRAGRDGCFRSLDIKERLHRGVAWVSLKATQRQKEFGFFFVCLFAFCLFRAVPTEYGGSQARGPIGVVAAGLHHSHSNARWEPHL